MDLSNVKGIADAGAALDALAVRGKISADRVRGRHGSNPTAGKTCKV